MAEDSLAGRTILVAEDEYMLATDLKRELLDAGAVVVGPVPSLEKALELIETTRHLDAAILDVNLQGEMVFAAADLLQERAVPFLFATGYDESVIPPRFQGVRRSEKPIGSDKLRQEVATLVARTDRSAGVLP